MSKGFTCSLLVSIFLVCLDINNQRDGIFHSASAWFTHACVLLFLFHTNGERTCLIQDYKAQCQFYPGENIPGLIYQPNTHRQQHGLAILLQASLLLWHFVNVVRLERFTRDRYWASSGQMLSHFPWPDCTDLIWWMCSSGHRRTQPTIIDATN